MQGKFNEIKNQKEQLIEIAEQAGEVGWKSSTHRFQAYACLKKGNLEEALRECEEALTIAIDVETFFSIINALYLKGLIYLEMKSVAKAQKTAEELKKLIDEGLYKKHIRYYYNLKGIIELKLNDFPKAIEYFKKANSLLPFQHTKYHNAQALFIDSLAFAYYQAGDLEKAKEEYNKTISLTIGRLYYGDIYAKSFYMLGKIYEQQGDTAKAIEHYEKFLDLWRDADPGILEAEDTRKRLDGLRSQ